MIKVLDQAALSLIDPTMRNWYILDIIDHPQAIHYIDCSGLDGWDWRMVVDRHPQFEDLCTEYGGWDMMDKVDWSQLLNVHPQFKKYRK